MKCDWLDSELKKLNDEQRNFVDDIANEIMSNSWTRHRIGDALREGLRFEHPCEHDVLISSDEFVDLCNDFITDSSYIAAINRLNYVLKNDQDFDAANESEKLDMARLFYGL